VIEKHLSDTYPIKNGLKHGDALSPRLLGFASHMCLGRFRKTRRHWNWMGYIRLRTYMDNVWLGKNMQTIKRNRSLVIC